MATTYVASKQTEITIPGGLCERATALFKTLADHLDSEGRLSAGDFIGLGQLAQLTVDVADLQEIIRRDGLSQTTETNQTARRIEVSTLNQHRVHLVKLLAHYGLTSKSRPAKPTSEGDDTLRDMLRARGDVF